MTAALATPGNPQADMMRFVANLRASTSGELADELTFAFHPEQLSLAKRALPSMGLISRPTFPLIYDFMSVQVTNLRQMLDVLRDMAGLPGTPILVRGRPLGSTGRRALMASKDGPPGLEAVPCRHLALDWEGFGLPGIDPCDGPAIAQGLRAFMPPELTAASFGWQITAGAGIKQGIRFRTWHWLSRPLASEEALRWLAPLHEGEGAMIDPCTLRAAQAIFLGVIEARPRERWGMWEGCGDTAAVPDIPPRPQAPARVRAAAARTRRAGQHADPGRMWQLIRECTAAIRAAKGQEGQRTATFQHWGFRALRLAELGGLDAQQVENAIYDAGAEMFEYDQERIARNIEKLLDWRREQRG